MHIKEEIEGEEDRSVYLRTTHKSYRSYLGKESGTVDYRLQNVLQLYFLFFAIFLHIIVFLIASLVRNSLTNICTFLKLLDIEIRVFPLKVLFLTLSFSHIYRPSSN